MPRPSIRQVRRGRSACCSKRAAAEQLVVASCETFALAVWAWEGVIGRRVALRVNFFEARRSRVHREGDATFAVQNFPSCVDFQRVPQRRCGVWRRPVCAFVVVSVKFRRNGQLRRRRWCLRAVGRTCHSLLAFFFFIWVAGVT